MLQKIFGTKHGKIKNSSIEILRKNKPLKINQN